MNDISCSNMLESRSTSNASHILTVLPPPPAKGHRASLTAGGRQNSIVGENEISPSHQPPSQPSSLILNPSTKNDSPSSSPVAVSVSPRSSLSLTGDKNWSFLQKDGSNWTNFEEHHHLLGNDEDNSERHSSDDDLDIWSITEEQREYYINQFKSMQPDLKKKISGATAKEFFEKSKLPVVELSKIWQLSDVDKDGALSIEEFCTAMHLVVLRRNNIDLPDVLPPSLVPRLKKTSEDVNIVPNQSQNASQSHVASSPKQTSPSEIVSPQSKEWTKFNDSPTSSLSSPGMKPVNFDFSAASVEQDPKILHPVAVRLSPERQQNSYPSTEKEQSGLSVSSALVCQASEHSADTISGPTHSSSFSGTSDTSKCNSLTLSSQTSVSLPQGPKKEPPPPPPPRSKHNHIRSSSLDLNKLGKTVPHFLGAPPAVPPRISPSTATPHKNAIHTDEQHHSSDNIDFADFTSFDDAENANPQLKSGAFEIYKKPLLSQDSLHVASSSGHGSFLLEQEPSVATDDSTALLVDISQPEEILERKRHPSAPPLAIAAASITTVPRDKRELQAAIKALKERNSMLTALNNELNQELSEIMEERIALEIQLEHLKPFS
ncbi:ralBP1-associated Eps domain-containing protein 1-like [Uloborus diversus]|uniref:ralBP1-associated Eps domain-containing protein 1-like n=1 Tax=Uloborus diversus TaxID=327109 RepID=UPI00240A7A3E|nr:ralBP1-associated Eps domain-containing protein 1-like [Uloborus diversus]